MATPIIVRPVATDDERYSQFYLSERAFSDDPAAEPNAESVNTWKQFITTLPDYKPELLRGAFLNEKLAGSYILYERLLHMGNAELLTGCIGAVNTDPTQRNQGVARALLEDATQYARDHHYALLLLDGIPKFYYRFGYSDVFDVALQYIDLAAILAQPRSAYAVREATLEDVQETLRLYQSVHYPYTASFTRSLAQEEHRMRNRSVGNPLYLAQDERGQVRGLLSLRRAPQRHRASELLTEDWEATLALLQYHAGLFVDQADAPRTLEYRLPINSPTTYSMIDHLQVPDTSNERDPNAFGAVRSQMFHHRHTGWMARIVDLTALLKALLPEWQARWEHSLAQWHGDLPFLIDGEPFVISIDGRDLKLGETDEVVGEEALQLTQQAFTQLLFGYRPVSWVFEDSSIPLSRQQIQVLNILFFNDHTCITQSDDF